MATDIRQDVEKIIKELIMTYGNNFMREWSNMLYYKIGDKLHHESIGEGCDLREFDICRLRNLVHKMRQLAIDNPEYIIYVGDKLYIDLDYEVYACVNQGFYLFIPVTPLIPITLHPSFVSDMTILRVVLDTDPLTQVLDYATLKLGTLSPSHSYVCPDVEFITYLKGNLGYLSMGSAKSGAVAYCTTFDDYIHKITSGQWGSFNKELESLWQRIYSKLKVYKKQLKSLPKKKRKKYCDPYAFKDLLSKEIEEADKLMQKYGITRVAFPLD